MTEKELLRKSGLYTGFILFIVSLFWFLFSIQTSFGGYTGGSPSGIDEGINSRSTTQTNLQVGTSGTYIIRLGIENVTGVGTATGYMTGTDTYYPRIVWTPSLGTLNFVGTGSYSLILQSNGAAIPLAGSISGKLDAVNGTGSGNVLTNTTLAGQGTITASFGANGLVITPEEYSAVNNASSELQAQIDTKLAKVGTVTTYLGSATAGGKTGTSSFSFSGGSNIIVTSTVTGDGHLAIIADTAGSASAKADIKKDGVVIVTNAESINFSGTNFSVSADTGTASVTLSSSPIFTGTATLGKLTTANGNNVFTGYPFKVTTATKTDVQSFSSSTFADITGLSVTVTPSSTSSTFLLLGAVSTGPTAASGNGGHIRYLRNSTPIGVGDAAGSRQQVTASSSMTESSGGMDSLLIPYIDSPGTTTAITYKVQMAASNATAIWVNKSAADTDSAFYGRAISTLTIMELGQ